MKEKNYSLFNLLIFSSTSISLSIILLSLMYSG